MPDEWYTPSWIFEELALVFDLDVAAPVGGISRIPAIKSYSVEDDGLKSPWFGLVWMNPPYSKPSPWVDKWLSHGNGVALLPAAKSRWTLTLWESKASVVMLDPRLKFETPDGKQRPIMMQCWLWAIGVEATNALEQGNFGRIR